MPGSECPTVPGRECPTECWEKVSAVPQGVSAQLCLGGGAQREDPTGTEGPIVSGEGPWEGELLCPMGCDWVHSVSWPEDKVSVGVITGQCRFRLDQLYCCTVIAAMLIT